MRAWLVSLLLLAAPLTAQSQLAQPRLEVALAPTQPTVGDRVRATLTLKVKTGELLGEPRFPAWGESWGAADVLGKSEPRKVREENGVAVWEQTVVLAAFRTGRVELPPVEAALPFRARTVAARTPPGLALQVRSVIPAGEKDPRPRAPRPPVPLPAGSPFAWTVAALSAACLALGLLLWRRRGGEAGEEAESPLLSPFDELARDLDRLSADLASEPSVVHAHARLSLALRRYLGRALSFGAAERTTSEIHRQLLCRRLPASMVRQTVELLRGCDMVKFARQEVGETRARERIEAARRIGQNLEDHLRPAETAPAAPLRAAG